MNIDDLYRRRAERLAKQPAAETSRTTFAALVFGLGRERYAIDLAALAEVLPFRECTEVLGAPVALVGVINVRGEIKPVVDLRRLLDLPSAEASSGYVVMLNRQGGAIGIQADTVHGIEQLDPSSAGSASTGAVGGSRFIKAVCANAVSVIDTRAALTALGL